MVWKEKRNGEPVTYDIRKSGPCKYTGEIAEVISFFGGRVECKTDLQNTYRFKGYKCSLKEEIGYSNPSCMDACPLIQKEHL